MRPHKHQQSSKAPSITDGAQAARHLLYFLPRSHLDNLGESSLFSIRQPSFQLSQERPHYKAEHGVYVPKSPKGGNGRILFGTKALKTCDPAREKSDVITTSGDSTWNNSEFSPIQRSRINDSARFCLSFQSQKQQSTKQQHKLTKKCRSKTIKFGARLAPGFVRLLPSGGPPGGSIQMREKK